MKCIRGIFGIIIRALTPTHDFYTKTDTPHLLNLPLISESSHPKASAARGKLSRGDRLYFLVELPELPPDQVVMLVH